MSRRLLCPLIAAIALVLFWSAPTEAQTARTFTLRLNHVLAPSEPYHQGFQTWAKRVDERTKGGLKIQVFHSAQLGVEEDIIEQMRQGAAIGQNTDAARLGNYVKGIAVMNGPYFAESLDDVDKLSRAPTILKWQEELAKQHGLKVVCFDWVQGSPPPFHKKPGKAPPGPRRLAHPPATRPDLAGIDPCAWSGSGGHGLRRYVSSPAAASDRWRRARLQQHPGGPLLRSAEA